MAININTIYTTVNAFMVQSTGGAYTPQAFNNACFLGETSIYSDDRARNGDSIEVINELLPFLATFNPPQAATGIYSLPSDYFRYLTVNQIVQGSQEQEVSILSATKWANRSVNQTVSRIRNPISNFYTVSGVKSLRVLPTTLTVKMYYFKQLIPAVWGFTSVNDKPVYDAGTSTNSMLDEAHFPELVYRIVSAMGVNVEKELVLQYINTK